MFRGGVRSCGMVRLGWFGGEGTDSAGWVFVETLPFCCPLICSFLFFLRVFLFCCLFFWRQVCKVIFCSCSKANGLLLRGMVFVSTSLWDVFDRTVFRILYLLILKTASLMYPELLCRICVISRINSCEIIVPCCKNHSTNIAFVLRLLYLPTWVPL